MRKKLRKQEGSTLVEMIVSFSLLVILVTAVSMLIPSAMKIYYGIRSQHEQRTIVYTISNRIKADLQSAVGVGNSMDGLSGEGYLCLKKINGSTIQNVNITELTPTAPLSGNSIEFIYEEGVMERIDANGFDGLIVRNNSRIRDAYLNGSNTGIASGAAIARYYVRGNDNRWQESIVYDSLNFSANAGVPVGDLTDGASYASAYAVECQYGEDFYRGYDVKINYEIPMNAIEKDIEFTVYGGKKVKASYVKYVNYTIALYQQDELKYEQKFCANIENAVPYYGTLSTTITDGSGGSIPVAPPSSVEEVVKEHNGVMWRDPLDPNLQVVDKGYAIFYSYLLGIAPPKDFGEYDVSKWRAEIDIGECDVNEIYFIDSSGNHQGGNKYLDGNRTSVHIDYAENMKKLVIEGGYLNRNQVLYFYVQLKEPHEWEHATPEDKWLPAKYSVTMTYERHYANAENFVRQNLNNNNGTTAEYQLYFKRQNGEQRILNFDYEFPYKIDDISQITYNCYLLRDMEIINQTNDSTTVRFYGLNLEHDGDVYIGLNVKGTNIPNELGTVKPIDVPDPNVGPIVIPFN
ncbi:MAG: type II secretion system protein [bacterium]|nr:type II secretion system protein [bacterium]